MSLRSAPHFPVIAWLASGCILVMAMVLLGGATRLTNSGLSMVNWSPLGSLPPMTGQEWQEEFDHYKKSPEFRIINHRFTVDDFKSIFWLEFIHRMTGRFTGLVFFIPFIWFMVRKKFPPGFLRKMLILLVLGMLQGAVGWFMVKSGLQKDPHVSHYRLAAHLFMALILFSYIFWCLLDLLPGKRKIWYPRSLWPVFLLVLLTVQVLFGAFTAGLKSGYLFPTFPLMGDRIIPLMSGMDAVSVQFIHRILAFVFLIAAFFFYYGTQKRDPVDPVKRGAKIFLWMILIQVGLGAWTVLSSVHLIPALAHQLIAFFLLAVLLWIIHNTAPSRSR